jgi:hypothetical protein
MGNSHEEKKYGKQFYDGDGEKKPTKPYPPEFLEQCTRQYQPPP